MAKDATTLQVTARETEGSRANRRLRRSGRIPGVIYGGGEDCAAISVDARELRHALAARGAVLEVTDGDGGTPAILKSAQYHPVRGETMHVDLLRVDLSVAIHAVVPLELTGGDDAPGTKEGGVLEQITRELNIEALPSAIPEAIFHDVSGMDINDTITLAEVTVPDGVTLLDDPETVAVTIISPSVEPTDDEIEVETQIVGDTDVAEAQAQGDTAEEAQQSADASGDS